MVSISSHQPRPPWSLQTCPSGPGDLEARVAVGRYLRYCGPRASAQYSLLSLALFSSP